MAEKRKRATAKGRFTRQETHLKGLLDIAGDKVIVTPAYEKFVECWNRLEEAHEDFVDADDIEVETDDDGNKYLDDLNARYGTLVQRYAAYLKTSSEKDRADRKAEDENERATEEASRKQIEAERKAADAELQKEEQDRKFTSLKAELDAGIVAFNGLAVGTKDAVSSSSDSVKHQELKKLEMEFDALKTQLVKLAGVDDSKDISEIRDKFSTMQRLRT
jgi:multidrug efflux pump subunit AcrA (membrane-fusion protein)